MKRNFVSISKLQRCTAQLMDEQFHHTFYWACDHAHWNVTMTMVSHEAYYYHYYCYCYCYCHYHHHYFVIIIIIIININIIIIIIFVVIIFDIIIIIIIIIITTLDHIIAIKPFMFKERSMGGKPTDFFVTIAGLFPSNDALWVLSGPW